MAVSSLVRPLCLCLGTLGLVQGLILCILTLLGVLVHLCVITVDSDETFSTFVPLVVGLYFQGAECQVYNTTVLSDDYFLNLVTPEWLFIWMAVYVGVSGLWIIFSTLIMSGCVYRKKILHYFLPCWIILTLGNCTMDLVLAVYFGFDFTDLISNASEIYGTSLVPVVPFAMMILSVKGGALWVINFIGSIFAIVALHNFVKHKDDRKPLFLERAGFLDQNPIDGFAPIEVPRPTSLLLNTNSKKTNISTIPTLHSYYVNHQDTRSELQSPISNISPLDTWRKPILRDIPDPDYSPTSTVTGLKNATDSQSTRRQQSLYNPTLPLRPSLKKSQQSYERKEDISL